MTESSNSQIDSSDINFNQLVRKEKKKKRKVSKKPSVYTSEGKNEYLVVDETKSVEDSDGFVISNPKIKKNKESRAYDPEQRKREMWNR